MDDLNAIIRAMAESKRAQDHTHRKLDDVASNQSSLLDLLHQVVRDNKQIYETLTLNEGRLRDLEQDHLHLQYGSFSAPSIKKPAPQNKPQKSRRNPARPF